MTYSIYSINGYLLGHASTLEHAERLLYTWFNASIVVSSVGVVVLRKGYPPILQEAVQ